MTNLDRLKGSSLFVQGLREFASLWCKRDLVTNVQHAFEAEGQEIYSLVPPQVRDFYDLVAQTPELKISDQFHGQDFLVWPPKFYRNNNQSQLVNRDFAWLAYENQGCWDILLSLRKRDYGSLFVCEGADVDESFQPILSAYPGHPEEFLAALFFHEIAFRNYCDPIEDITSVGQLIYSGHYPCNGQATPEKMDIYFHSSDGVALVTDYGLVWAMGRRSVK